MRVIKFHSRKRYDKLGMYHCFENRRNPANYKGVYLLDSALISGFRVQLMQCGARLIAKRKDKRAAGWWLHGIVFDTTAEAEAFSIYLMRVLRRRGHKRGFLTQSLLFDLFTWFKLNYA